MAQIFRAYKSEIPVFLRIYYNHGYHQRYRCNYYEVLRVSPNATQKEIKDAFIRLSKETHPDSGNKGNHSDFVLINEAYMVLSKKSKRQEYDMNLKCNNTYNTNSFQQNNYHRYEAKNFEKTYADFKNWEAQARDDTRVEWKFSRQDIRKLALLCTILFIVGTAIQLAMIQKFVVSRRQVLERRAKYQMEYKKFKEDIERNTTEKQFQRVDLSKKYGLGPYDE